MKIANIILALFLAAPGAFAEDLEPSNDWQARLSDVSGEVLVFSADGEAEGLPAEEGMPLQMGDRIQTGPGSEAELTLDGDVVVSLSEKTDFTLTSTIRKDGEFKLDAGALVAKVKFLLAGGLLHVRTNTAVAAVRGTEFGVESDEDGSTHVGVFDEGKVEVESSAGAAVFLGPNQETSVAEGQAPRPAARLVHFLRHAKRMKALRKRHQALLKKWKSMPPANRQEMRKKVIQRLRDKGRPGKRLQRKPRRK